MDTNILESLGEIQNRVCLLISVFSVTAFSIETCVYIYIYT